jgi:di/tripeptidase
MNKLVFFYSDECEFSQNAKPFAVQVATELGYELDMFEVSNPNTPKMFIKDIYPILYLVIDGEIALEMRGFSSDAAHLDFYKDHINYFLNPPVMKIKN